MGALYRGLLAVLAGLGALIIAIMVALVIANVIGRSLGLGGIRWTDEVSEYGLYAITLLAAPWLLERGAHIRVDIILTTLPPRVGWVLELIADILGVLISSVIAWSALQAVLQAARFGNTTIKTLVFPEWWLFAPLAVGFVLIGLVFVKRFVVALGGPRRPSTSDAASLM